jgi:hypothetical protein
MTLPIMNAAHGLRANRYQPLRAGSARRGVLLPDALRARLESFFDADFSGVRVHVGKEAGAIGAIAFTHGENLYFAPGRYDPNSREGVRLLAHELAHVIQQREGRVHNPHGHGVALVEDNRLENEADKLADELIHELYPEPSAPVTTFEPDPEPAAGAETSPETEET